MSSESRIEVQQPNRHLSMLVVMPDEDGYLTLARIAAENQLYLITAREGIEALLRLRQVHVDIIAVDACGLKMPMDEFLAEARTLQPEAIRIVLGPSEARDEMIDATARGLAHQYLPKPWLPLDIGQTLSHAVRLRREIKEESLEEVLPSMTDLPSPPGFQARLHRVLNTVDGSLNELIRELELNPALVAKIIQVANSVHFASRRTITSIRDAVIFIGVAHIDSLIMAVDVFQSFQKKLTGEGREHIEALWQVALRRAAIAKKIGENFDHLGNPHVAYVTALLQDVGFLVRLYTAPRKYELFLEVWSREGISKYEADVRVFRVPHDRVGATLLELWNFPMDIVNAVLNHHGDTGSDLLTTIIQIADELTSPEEKSPHDSLIEPFVEMWKMSLT